MIFVQIDIIKPNLSELRVLMTECCLRRDMNVSKKSLIIKALNRGTLESSHPNFISDVRVMASGLLHVMMMHSNSSRGGGKCVVGKHVIVTLGDQGLLWVSSNGEAMDWDGKARSTASDVIELDDNTYAR